MVLKKSPLQTSPSPSTNVNALEGNPANQSAAKGPVGVKSNSTPPAPKNGDRKAGPKTRITIKYDAGFSNNLFIRGKGATLSWDKGQSLTNTKPDEWVWETSAPFTTCEFKVLINDNHYEIGDNHLLTCGASIHFTPKFH